MLSAYVAASSTELDRARSAMRALAAMGVRVYDWTTRWRPTVELTHEERASAAHDDMRAIRAADLVLVLAPSVRSDALVELGYALRDAHVQRIVVAGPLGLRGIFAALCDEHDTDAAALEAIERWAREVRG